MRRGKMSLLAVGVAAVLTLGACTSDNDAEPAAQEPTGATTEQPAEQAGGMTITDIVADTPEFSTLLTAVSEAGLAETLADEGPYTVFAPTDEAFAALPEGTLESLLEPKNQEQLQGILTYHVVPAEIMAADVTAGEVTTVNGETFTVSVEGDQVLIADAAGNQATVVQTDIGASNGVVHVIDTVLLPQG